RFYFTNHNERKKVLDNIKFQKEDLEEQLKDIELIKKGKKKDEEGKRIKFSREHELKEVELNQLLDIFWLRYDTYSDDNTCHYRKVARENDFELVGWYQLLPEELELVNDMNITFDQIQKIESTALPKLFILYWDIESCSTRGPGFLPIGEEKDDYVYMIQMDLCLLNSKEPLRRYNISTMTINKELFKQTYNINNIEFINAIDQVDLLLKFAELFRYLRPDFEIGYNTGSYDWNFVLRKAYILGIEEQFISNLLNKKNSSMKYYIRETTVRVVEKDIEENMQKYEFAGININNRKIKVNPMENRTCEYFHLPETVFLDLLIWAQKTFPTALSNTLNNVLVRCGLPGKIDLLYVPDEETKDLNCMFIYITALKYYYDIITLSDLSLKLSNLT